MKLEFLLLMSALVALDGCGASSNPGESTTEGDAATDARSLDAQADAEVEGGPTRGDAGSDASACSPVDVSTFKPTYHPPHAWEGACSSDEIETFVSLCLEGDPNSAECSAFVTTHASCERCIDSEVKDGSYGAIVWNAQANYYRINEPGCVALVDQDMGTEGCAAAQQAVLQCGEAACLSCPTVTETASLAACEDQAYEGACSDYLARFKAKCTDIDSFKYVACRDHYGIGYHWYVVGLVRVFCQQTERDAAADTASHD